MEAQWLVHLIHKQKVGVHIPVHIPVVAKFFSHKYFSFFPFQPLSHNSHSSNGFSVLDSPFREFRPFSVETEKWGLYLGPCIISRGLSWLVGSSAPDLGNQAKRYALYRKFWWVLRRLGLWSHPLYPSEKTAHTNVSDVRVVIPKCVVTIIFLFFLLTPVIISYVICVFMMSEGDSLILREFPTWTLNPHD